MKAYIKQLLMAVVACAALASCAKEEVPGFGPATGSAGDPVELRIEIDRATYATTDLDFNSEFETGDTIGLYVVRRPRSVADSTLQPAAGYLHLPVVLDASGDWKWVGDTLRYPRVDTLLDIYAYYPYDRRATDPTAIAFGVEADQRDARDFSRSDLMSDSMRGVEAGRPVELSFAHRLALIEFTIADPGHALDTTGFDSLPTVTLQGRNLSGKFSMISNAISEQGGVAEVTMHLADTATLRYRALVPVQYIDENTNLFKITIPVPNAPDSTYTCQSPNGRLLEAGRVERYNFTYVAPPVGPTSTPVKFAFVGKAFTNGEKAGVFVQRSDVAGYTHLEVTYDGADWSYPGTLDYPDAPVTLSFYAYYPYNGSYGNPAAIPFNVAADQSGALAASTPIRWGRKIGATQSSTPQQITLQGLMMAQVQTTLTLNASSDFDDSRQVDVTATIKSVKTAGTIDLISGGGGIPTLTGGAVDVKMYATSQNNFEAQIPVQSLPDNSFSFNIPRTGGQADLAWVQGASRVLQNGTNALFGPYDYTANTAPVPVVFNFTGPTFSTNDAVSVWVHLSTDAPATYEKTNLQVTTNDGGATWSYTGDLNYPATGTLSFYACYPYDAAYADPTAIGFSVPMANPLQRGAAPTVAASSDPVAIPLQSIESGLAQVDLQVTFNGSSDYDETRANEVVATIQNVQTSATLDLTDGSITATGSTGPLSMDVVTEAADFSVLLPVQELPGSNAAFTIVVPREAPLSDTYDWSQGPASAEQLSAGANNNYGPYDYDLNAVPIP